MNKKSNFIFVGQFVYESESYNDNNISQAGNNYQLRLIDILKPLYKYSLLPLFLNPKLFTINNDEYFKRFSGRDYRNKLIRLFFDTFDLLKCLYYNKTKHVVFYNIDIHTYIIILFSIFFLRKKVFIIIADFPYYKKNVISKFIHFLISHSSGCVILNSNIDINARKFLSIGIVNDKNIILNTSGYVNRKVILSGSLGITTGLILALNTFSQLPDFELHISGRPYKLQDTDLQHLINTFNKKYNNIFYHGLLNSNDYLNLLKNCDIALSLRNPNDLEHQYNFPSKILEYLSNSKIVISTLEYNDLPNHLYFYCNYDESSLKNCLEKISNFNKTSIDNYRNGIYETILEIFSTISFKKNFLNFIFNEKNL